MIRRKARRSTASSSIFKPMAELLSAVEDEPRWTWDGLVAPGALSLVYGPAKVGKSTLVYGLLGALAGGEPFLNRTTLPTRALILSEEPPEAIRSKLQRFGGLEVHHGVSRADLRPLTWAEQIAQAETYARGNEVGLLVIDTFADLAGLRGDEENDAGAVQAALDPIKAAAERIGWAALLVHHSRKAGGPHGAGVRGSSAFTAAVDVFAELSRNGSGASRVLRHESRYRPEGKIELTLSDGGYAAKLSREEMEFGLILAALAQGPHASLELGVVTGIKRSTLDRRLAALSSRGSVRRLGDEGRRGAPLAWALA